ncbi:hypothetical protein AYJ08_04690 [Brevibacillus sp. SKDU10]|uniref:TrmO family methyltransferase domain-containing protein n=1 Tax=Brevibacillus sp. SKDU10 TaxID=1247872 RepID=UPI0007C8D138|nr:hypothetical protein AYJ08_04690 [Brevibacillus sp. SKDU10]
MIDTHKDRLIVKGLDAIHETPVLDIKPYFPVFDHVSDIQVPDWVDYFNETIFLNTFIFRKSDPLWGAFSVNKTVRTKKLKSDQLLSLFCNITLV